VSCAEIRRLLAALAAAPAERARSLAWFRWRQHHQTEAQRCHEARRLRAYGAGPDLPPAPLGRSVLPAPTQEQWTQILALLVAADQGGHPPPVPHRPVLEGLFWMLEHSARWEDIPEHFGPYRTIQTRYRRWRLAGIWVGILAILSQPADAPTSPT
jgi:hypothetical protein